jgi:polyhydroxybutyrate depolymerase
VGGNSAKTDMMKLGRILGWGVAILALLVVSAAALGYYLLDAPAPPEPDLRGETLAGTIRVGERDRTYIAYIPANARPSPPLVIAFHGSMGSSKGMRIATGYEFDRLADEHGFIVVYPQGYQGHWNDCRKVADYSARKLNIDDAGFVDALIAQLRTEHGADATRVFVTGVSNGGQFVFRLALEHPERIAGAAVFGANLPTPDNSDCTAKGPPPPVMLVNGTSDPLNPHAGGTVTMFGFGNRGTVVSALASAEYFAGQLGAAGPARNHIDAKAPGDTTSADWLVWGEPGREVVLVSVNGGGHVVPQPVYRSQRLLGAVTSAINGPAEAWAFFSRQPPRGSPPVP